MSRVSAISPRGPGKSPDQVYNAQRLAHSMRGGLRALSSYCCPIAPLRALILPENRSVSAELLGQAPEIRALSGAMGQS
jgi:hypothetical protein